MAILIGELYDALIAAGCPPDKARLAAEAVYRDCGGRASSRPPFADTRLGRVAELLGSVLVAWLLYALWLQWSR